LAARFKNFQSIWIELTLIFLCGVSIARAENWPQWRGPTGQGISSETGIATAWSKTENIRWRTETPGEGHSSPIVWEDRVFLTTATDEARSRRLLSLDAGTGAILWSSEAVRVAEREPMHDQNNAASSTPATDGRAIYTSFHADDRVHVAAFDFDGKKLWESRPLAFKSEHGYSYSPTLHDGILFLSVDQWGEAAVIALEAATGNLKWKFPLDTEWCSNVPPLVIESAGATQVVTTGNNLTRAFDPSSGRLLWKAEGPTSYCAASLAFGEGVLLTHGGYPDRRALAFRIDGHSESISASVAWEKKRGTPYVPSPVYDDGYFYSVNDDGIALCLDAKTGEMKWQERIGGFTRSSLIAVEGNLYTTNDEGVTTVFKATPEGLRVVSKNSLEELVYSSPAVSGGRLYLRTASALYCISQ
jgi:outer membrane protein assembly factor BamB